MEDKAIIFPRGNVSVLQDKLQECCNHPEIVEKYQQNAADYICRKYNWDEVVKKTLELYQQGQEETRQALEQI